MSHFQNKLIKIISKKKIFSYCVYGIFSLSRPICPYLTFCCPKTEATNKAKRPAIAEIFHAKDPVLGALRSFLVAPMAAPQFQSIFFVPSFALISSQFTKKLLFSTTSNNGHFSKAWNHTLNSHTTWQKDRYKYTKQYFLSAFIATVTARPSTANTT